MTVYWLLFAYFAIGALVVPLQAQRAVSSRYFLFIGIAAMAVIIGLRDRVGADWFTYKRIFARASRGFNEAILSGDPGYAVLNWLVKQVGGDIWLVNLVCAVIFVWGLWRFAKVQRDSWLTVLVAVPYLVIVVAMGYTRQGVAIGFILAGLAALIRGGTPLRFIGYAVAAALFHRSAVAIVPLVLMAGRRNQFISIVIGLAVTYFLYDLLVADATEVMVRNYITVKYQSQGAGVRLAMTALPALLVLAAGRRFGFEEQERLIWRNFSLAALGLVLLYFVLPSSTAVDRLALYVLPLQLAVMARIPGSLVSVNAGRILVVIYALAIQYVWLNYAANADGWLPYQAFGFS